MKIYMALNEEGTEGDIGLHTRMAILSARQNTDFELVLLYTGERNHRTRWFERHGVRIVDSKVPYEHVIVELTREGRYWTKSLGHWLRTNLCLEEKDEEFAVYTDVDVIFMEQFDPKHLKPRVFCAAPEFQRDVWNYFNAGVMIANIPRLRREYGEFENYLVQNIREHTYNFHDQIAYNTFYRDLWEKLPVEMNWKPYWGLNRNAKVVHFHGPKPGAMTAILDGRWGWKSNHEIQIASLFCVFINEYKHFLAEALRVSPGLEQQDVDYISAICERIPTYDKGQNRTDLEFMNYKMFPSSPSDTDNLALGKSATQSSTCEWSRSRDATEDASGGNNGIIDGGYGFHTATEADPWWQVDLEKDYNIEKILLFNRKDAAARLKNFSVLTSPDATYWEVIYRKSNDEVFGDRFVEPYDIRIDQANITRYLRIRLDGVSCLHFSEIQVYGSEPDAAFRSRHLQELQSRAATRAAIPVGRTGKIVDLDGLSVFVDEQYHPAVIEAFVNGGYEHRERRLVRKLLRHGDRVIECGTAAGVVTMTTARIVGAENVTTFEANPQIARDAAENFERNALSAITLHNGILKKRTAVAHPDERVSFFIDQVFVASRLNASLSDPGIVAEVRIPVFCLEDEIAKRSATVIIADIEGGEVDLFNDIDLSMIRLIIMETHYGFVGEAATNDMVRSLVLQGFDIDLNYTSDQMAVFQRRW